MPSVLIAKEDGVALLDFDLKPGKTYTIGRSAGADIRLEAQSISRLHAIMYPHKGDWRLADLGSKKGLRIEDGVTRDHMLEHGGWVAIGPAIIWYFDERAAEGAPSENPTDDMQSQTADEPQRTLQVLMVEREGVSETLPVALVRKAVSIGSSANCDITIDAPELDPLHMIVFRVRGIWHVARIGESVELMDDAGTPTRCTTLSAETKVRVGALTLSIMDACLPAPAANEFTLKENIEPDSLKYGDPLDIDLEAQ